MLRKIQSEQGKKACVLGEGRANRCPGNYSVCQIWFIHNNISIKRLLYEKGKREVGLEFNHQESFREGCGSGGGRQNPVVVALFTGSEVTILVTLSIKLFFHLQKGVLEERQAVASLSCAR